jgi:hypothetical protein
LNSNSKHLCQLIHQLIFVENGTKDGNVKLNSLIKVER